MSMENTAEKMPWSSKEEDENKKERELRKKILDSLGEAGCEEPEKLHEEIIKRLILLEAESKFNEDSRKIERGVCNVLDYLEQHFAEAYPQMVLAKDHKIEGRIAAIVHDIGKSGPAEANEQERLTVVRLFAQEQIKDPQLTLEKAATENFSPEEAREMLENLKNCGIDSQVTMRQFWDMHAIWTHDILEKFPSGLNRRVRIIAGSHHFNKGINPYDLAESEVPIESSAIGLLEDYVNVIAGRVLTFVDQYEANVRRSGSDHENAMAWVRENPLNKNDKIMELICDAIDELGKNGKIFS